MGVVTESIRSWQYDFLRSEKDAEDSLFVHLQSHFEGLEIKQQFPYDNVRADIVIESSFAIELKYDLVKDAEYKRLIGQLEGYAHWGVDLLVLVVGDIDSSMKQRIEKRLEKDWGDLDDAAKLISVPKTNGGAT